MSSLSILMLLVAAGVAPRAYRRLQLSRAKHPSLGGHARWSRRIAKLIRYFEYDEDVVFVSDGAPAEVGEQRRAALLRLQNNVRATAPRALQLCKTLENDVSDVRFTAHYRVPFPYRKSIGKDLAYGSIVDETNGVRIKDIDGNWRYDLSGSYGVNVFGYDFYKDCIARGAERVAALGPVLGPYHPLIHDNVERLKAISGLDEVSFHMSGTEAVMQAVRLARYHTRRSHLVRFCGAYHGWWDGVQPGVGNQRRVNDVYTLADVSERSLRVLETRDDIACVLVNAAQALHPNADPGSDSVLVASDRRAQLDRARYAEWLQRLRDVCRRRGIVLIFDEVFTGFRLARRGAQEYFGVAADLVTYGKTLGGGLPVGVLCGRADLMKRFRDEAPADVSFARGTFNSHPYVMGAMNEFLRRLDTPDIAALYDDLDARWDARAAALNSRLEAADVPVRVANLQSVFSTIYTTPGRYNWMLQFYLKAHGLELGWIGTARMIFSLDYGDEDFDAVAQRIVGAAEEMKRDQWFWAAPQLTNEAIRKAMLRDMIRARLPWFPRRRESLAGTAAHPNPEEAVQHGR